APGVQELPGVPCPPPGRCCHQILNRARLRWSCQLSPPPGTVSPDCVTLRRFLHRTCLVHPEVEFHFCVSVDGTVTSRTYGPEGPGALAGARLRVRSCHFTPPPSPGGVPSPCPRIHPLPGSPIPLRVPPPAAAAGLGGDLSVLPVTALCPCHRAVPNLPTRLAEGGDTCAVSPSPTCPPTSPLSLYPRGGGGTRVPIPVPASRGGVGGGHTSRRCP
ncbi:type 2 DNA topoisomerase 6 subunit B-like, partial [Caloenas nicobarica]|uniref:type 2 DNA topoisomerase 6 subunit B-like n=1 Tax=Caloenas nicobarica TaxID=187106 RepID=UPI0032B811FC